MIHNTQLLVDNVPVLGWIMLLMPRTQNNLYDELCQIASYAAWSRTINLGGHGFVKRYLVHITTKYKSLALANHSALMYALNHFPTIGWNLDCLSNNDAKCWHVFGSYSGQVPEASKPPNYYLDQHWLIIKIDLWHLHGINLIISARKFNG